MTGRKGDTRRNWENRTNETRQTKTRRQVTGTAVPDSRSDKLESTKCFEVLHEAARTREQTWEPEL